MVREDTQKNDSLLAAYRVLDLSDEKGFLCGKVLADLGADVIKIEKPGGDPARRIGPFYHEIPDLEKSLYWFAFNANKRGITLDIETNDGGDIFKRLVAKADFVIESFPPGYLDKLGLGYSVLSGLNPRIIMTSITPFGQSGPYKDYKGSDIVASAMGGLMYICGDSDRPPVRITHPQSYLHAGSHAAAGTLIAHYYREMTEEGQHVDVSIQDCVVSALQFVQQYWDLNKYIVPRLGPKVSRFGLFLRLIRQCKDGFVVWRTLVGGGGVLGGEGTRRIVEAIDREGSAGNLRGINFEEISMDYLTQEEANNWDEAFDKYFEMHTKEELYREALKRRFPLFPVSTPKDILENDQLRARNFWVDIQHPELDDTIRYPGAFFKSNESFSTIRRRAPLIGEHNVEIYETELGLSKIDLTILKQSNVI